MNKILQLNGTLHHAKREGNFGLPVLPSNGVLRIERIDSLIKDLEQILLFWQKQPDIGGVLLSGAYIQIAAKSNRIRSLLSKDGKPSDFVVGARFETYQNRPSHTLSYFVSNENIRYTIRLLQECKAILTNSYHEEINAKQLEKLSNTLLSQDKDYPFSKTKLIQAFVDCYYVYQFKVDMDRFQFYVPNDTEYVTLYKTGISIYELLSKYGLRFIPTPGLDDNTVILKKEEFQQLKEKAPFLIAMVVSDLNEMEPQSFSRQIQEPLTLPPASNEPVIGVIDTLYNGPELYSGWVESYDLTNKEIAPLEKDYLHGTAVSTLIVNGPDYNQTLQDNCGYFRVRHFGVARADGYSSFSVIRNIREIIANNRDIKVWNLSLGSPREVSPNFISPEAAILDQLQKDYDVIFVIAATNRMEHNPESFIVGAPADSINGLVVGAVDVNNKVTSYSRRGPVLSFFQKPDVCYYGGDDKHPLALCSHNGVRYNSGTSFAAPFITRKLAFLIYRMGLTKETAKALLIDAAVGWNSNAPADDSLGFGIVPVDIRDILETKDDEIKFFINGISDSFDTYSYNIPVPMDKDKYPYKAKVAICYSVNSSRNQGVDYTNTELDVHFGRIDDKKRIKSINGNIQNEDVPLTEAEARKRYRKWDNVKCICETITDRSKPTKSYSLNKNWGFSIKQTSRSDKKEQIRFGLVITLKEISGVNRIERFIRDCYANNWMVIPLDIHQRNEVFNKAEEELKFE